MNQLTEQIDHAPRATYVAGSAWWVRSSQNWQYEELLMRFLQASWDAAAASVAAEILQEATLIDQDYLLVGLNARAIA
ncbi:hypothetical protein [Legionella impletisoli]|uniref:hypothetical protein n=1 Tax=Legionella impletisoli TaxID=343510 RepID=UPI0010419A71|nr:hypothetical protein [Legionella impletisoli]